MLGGVGGGIAKEHKETFGGEGLSIIFTVMMVLKVYSCPNPSNGTV